MPEGDTPETSSRPTRRTLGRSADPITSDRKQRGRFAETIRHEGPRLRRLYKEPAGGDAQNTCGVYWLATELGHERFDPARPRLATRRACPGERRPVFGM
jgi:hypothetical protein